jgi:hypothetical protein
MFSVKTPEFITYRITGVTEKDAYYVIEKTQDNLNGRRKS